LGYALIGPSPLFLTARAISFARAFLFSVELEYDGDVFLQQHTRNTLEV
jgi:hypothetical protein